MSKEAIFQGVRMQTRKAITRTISRTAVNESETADLARRIAAYAPHDGTFDLSIPGLHVSRFSRINASCAHAIQLPALCLIVRGAKTVIVGQEVYEYDASRMLVFSVALPVAAQVTRASHADPYLALRLDFDPQKIADLVHMSVSSFHEHFKAVTSMSPLHYQKVLRLQEARRLMLSAMTDASTASQRVGYLSPSQFSREYSRFFGSAPTKDIARLRQDTQLLSATAPPVD